MPAIDCYRGFVNTWECDEIGHLNVQFYIGKLHEGLMVLRGRLGLTPAREQAEGVSLRARSDHIRYLAERMAGDGIGWRIGVLEAHPNELQLYAEMWASGEAMPAAAVRIRLHAIDTQTGAHRPVPADILAAAQAYRCTAPDATAPRGLRGEDDLPDLTLDQAQAGGLFQTQISGVQPWQCDVFGWQLAQHYIGRISDGAGHCFDALGLSPAELRRNGHGVVALEQRIDYGPPLVAGTAVTVYSGLLRLGGKTLEFGHWLFDASTGQGLAKMRAVTVLFDLRARRSLPIEAEQRDRLEKLCAVLPAAAQPA